MARNRTIGHSQDPALADYSEIGHLAAQRSNVAVAGADTTAAEFIDLWAGAPFHLMAMLRPHLTTVGFASAHVEGQRYAALNVIDGLGPHPAQTGWPRVFPSGTTPYTRYGNTEIPDPTTPCGGPGNYGTPIIADFGVTANAWEVPTVTTVTAHLMEDGLPIATCATTPADHGEHGWTMDGTRALILPRQTLQPGSHYTGTITTNLGTANINFRIAQTTRDFPGW